MRVAFGTDEQTAVSKTVVAHLIDSGHHVDVLADPLPWPEVGRTVGEAVAGGKADLGVVCCWTGTGVSIAANKVRGVRAALCGDPETAIGARKWNDANVLALSLRSTSEPIAREILDAFLAGKADPTEAGNIARVE